MEIKWSPGRRRLLTLSVFTFFFILLLFIGTVRAQIVGGGLGGTGNVAQQPGGFGGGFGGGAAFDQVSV